MCTYAHHERWHAWGLPIEYVNSSRIRPTVGVLAVCVTKDGKCAITTGWDGTARLLSLASGECLRVFRGHTAPVVCACLSPDQKLLYTGSWDRTAKAWDLEDARCLRTYRGHAQSVMALAVSGDGRLLATGSMDNDTLVRHTPSDLRFCNWRPHFNCVRSILFVEAGRRLVTSSEDGTAKLWDIEWREAKLLHTFEGHVGLISSACLTPDHECLITASSDRSIKVWDLHGRRCMATLGTQAIVVQSVAGASGGGQLAVLGQDRVLRTWDHAAEGRVWRPLTAAANAAGRWILGWRHGVCSVEEHADHTIRVGASSSAAAPAILPGHSSCVHSAAISGSGRTPGRARQGWQGRCL